MYSIDMQPAPTPYRCRLCGAASYRRLTHRGPDGAMTYNDLYRCSGCSATFADPAAWRQAATKQAPEATVRLRGAGIGPSDHAGPVPELMSTSGSKRTDKPDPSLYGYNDADTKAITEAAARANRVKSKHRR